MANDPLNYPFYDRFKSAFEAWQNTLGNTVDIWNDAYKAITRPAIEQGARANSQYTLASWLRDIALTYEEGATGFNSALRALLLGPDEDKLRPQWLTFNLRDDPALDDDAQLRTAGVWTRQLVLRTPAIGGKLKTSTLAPLGGQSKARIQAVSQPADSAGRAFTITLSEFYEDFSDPRSMHRLGDEGLGPADLRRAVHKAAGMKDPGKTSADRKQSQASATGQSEESPNLDLSNEFIGFVSATGEGAGPPRAVVFVLI